MQEFEATRRLAVVTRDSNDAVTVQDMEGRILAWNPGAERLYGWREAEALGMNIREIIPKDLREDALAEVRSLGGAETLAPLRTRRITRDGRVLEVMLTASSLVNAAGETYAISVTERQLKEKGHDR
jgi:two-component system CheB/CheR fusion protein